jgi:hypothetical protein
MNSKRRLVHGKQTPLLVIQQRSFFCFAAIDSRSLFAVSRVPLLTIAAILPCRVLSASVASRKHSASRVVRSMFRGDNTKRRVAVLDLKFSSSQ